MTDTTFTPDPDNCGHCYTNAPHTAAEHFATGGSATEDHGPGCDGPFNCTCPEPPVGVTP